ncbi:MAG TPA: DNA polymerase/3'-5' exonuclease PolX [Gemmatimonadaceae bacterium]|nr:DNA polymerase/3'-5' exonuclease PolX [Gemmatimonadaceae bacterium]
MDPRTAAHVLGQIAAHLELRGESTFKSRAYEQAATALLGLDTDDLGPLLRSGELAATRGLGPATLAVVRDLIETGESRYLEQLRATTPPGLLELLRVPGLGTAKIQKLHAALGVDSLESLESAARDGRLAKLPRYGPKTAEKILRGIERLRATGTQRLYPQGAQEGAQLVRMVRAHPDVIAAEIAGSLRRRRETVGDVDIVAACLADPAAVAGAFGSAPGVRSTTRAGAGSIAVTYVDGTRLDLHCVFTDDFAVALWRATGSIEHVAAVTARLAERGFSLEGNRLLDAGGTSVPAPNEDALYAQAGLAFVPPELREGRGEIEAAAAGSIPTLLEPTDVRGVLHCHSTWSDGKATIAQMADAAGERGWSYIGITDHSQSAFYASGLSRDRVLAQHDEIDSLNASRTDVRVLKGVEADILADGALDYDEALLDRFDFVIGSVHSRFSMDRATMTARVLRALDSRHLTILGHPTGRLLLSREPYPIDVEAVLEKAAGVGAAVELNADPHRLDLDWRHLPRARALGVPIEIGPDAHSPKGLDHMTTGIGIARKGGLAARDVLNTRSADEVLAFARARRERGVH